MPRELTPFQWLTWVSSILMIGAVELRAQTRPSYGPGDSSGVLASVPTTFASVAPDQGEHLYASQVLVKGFSFTGNSVFSSNQLAEIANSYLKQRNGMMKR